MRTRVQSSPAPFRYGLEAFSLIEILVAVALMAVIVVGLLAMFYQTQRAFRSSATQMDVLEAGRSAMQLVRVELKELYPTRLPEGINLLARPAQGVVPLEIVLPGNTISSPNLFTNELQDLSFLVKQNDEWVGYAYRISNTVPNLGLGTLYRRIDRRTPDSFDPTSEIMDLSTNIAFASVYEPNSDFRRVIDGVVHFRCLPYDTNGVMLPTSPSTPGGYVFESNNMPAYIDLEMGILEPRALEQFRARSDNPTVAQAYLVKRAGSIHIFKQRIPIRSVP